MTRIITIDFETKGLDWVYKYHNYIGAEFKVLVMGWYDGINSGVVTDFSKIPQVLKGADTIVAHNAAFDLGCLLSLGLKDLVDEIYGKVVCTMLAAKLYNSALSYSKIGPTYGLDNLSHIWLNNRKTSADMARQVYEAYIYPLTKKEEKERDVFFKEHNQRCPKLNTWKRASWWELSTVVRSKIKNWTMANLDVVFYKMPNLVNEYCVHDCKLTFDLYKYLANNSGQFYSNPSETFKFWSKLCHVTNDYTARGVRVDNVALEKARVKLIPFIEKYENLVYKEAGERFNIASPQECGRVFKKLGLKTNTTATGLSTVNEKILKITNHPIADYLKTWKKYTKALSSTFKRLETMQQNTLKEGQREDRRYGRVHFWFKPFEATTGRFSSNAQQIPKRDEEIAELARSIFVPEEGKKWHSYDWSDQEGRLQVHAAFKFQCPGILNIIRKYKVNPEHDGHQEVAEMMGVTRPIAKGIKHGLTYGMGKAKMAASVGVEEEDVKVLLDKFHKSLPFVRSLIQKINQQMKQQGFVKTICGRVVRVGTVTYNNVEEPAYYKSLNYWTQGSAGDMVGVCMIKCYEAGIPLQITMHDELDGSLTEEEGKKVKDIMTNTIPLCIPSVVDYGIGNNWWEAC